MKEIKVDIINQNIIQDLNSIIANSQDRAIRSVDFERILMYWKIGKRIFEEEQHGKDRAEYGSLLIKEISNLLEPIYGNSYSFRNLNWYRQFYRTFPIVNALSSQLSWTHYRLLLKASNEDKRNFYIAESVKNNWSSRQLERQINRNECRLKLAM